MDIALAHNLGYLKEYFAVFVGHGDAERLQWAPRSTQLESTELRETNDKQNSYISPSITDTLLRSVLTQNGECETANPTSTESQPDDKIFLKVFQK
jgi:hypothetical protein